MAQGKYFGEYNRSKITLTMAKTHFSENNLKKNSRKRKIADVQTVENKGSFGITIAIKEKTNICKKLQAKEI